MAFSLQRVVPWGRSFGEYERMFALTADDLQGRILGCGDGPASFNAEATRRGARIVSADPLYEYTAAEIRNRINATCPEILEQARQNRADFIWAEFTSVEELGRARMVAMEQFLADYEGGRASGRYVTAELPRLPFSDAAFDLALCSHFLFLYSAEHDERFHVESVIELCRVAQEVRLFPLLQLGGAPSPHVPAVRRELQRRGWQAQTERVPYEFQRGGNQMLRIGR